MVLHLLNKHDRLSRKEIASLSGLTPAGVTKICQTLIDEGYIRECGELLDDGKIGRREILLTLCLDEKLVVGINAEQDVITLSLSNLAGELLASHQLPFNADIDFVVDSAYAFVSSLHCDMDRVIACGVCVIGSPYEDDFGVWDSDSLAKKLEDRLHLRVVLDNNVKAFALSTLIYGDTDDDSVLFLKWGPGIGSSIVANGRVFSGNDSGVAEIGHYIVNTSGKPCRCGRYGCLETEASAEAIISEVNEILTLDKIIHSEDNKIINILDHKIDLVALALTNTATILNIRSIVLFGSMFQNQSIAEKLIRQCHRYNSNLRDDMISTAVLNDRSDYIGAVAICAKHCFFEGEV